jgi:hypothetical protein
VFSSVTGEKGMVFKICICSPMSVPARVHKDGLALNPEYVIMPSSISWLRSINWVTI